MHAIEAPNQADSASRATEYWTNDGWTKPIYTCRATGYWENIGEEEGGGERDNAEVESEQAAPRTAARGK